jgi:hypothetical protein
LTDGTIRDFADTTKSYVEFDTLAGNYYLVLYHRNHLPIMTAAAQSLNGATPSAYDFTTSQGQAYGTNPMKLVGTKYCLYGGDVNHSAVVTASDANLIVEQLLTPGYNDRDVNLSGVVSSADVNVVYANLLQASQVPAPSLNPSLTSTKEEKDIPTAFALEQNYPNPFNPSTTIRYDLPVGSHVSVKIYDLLGREVAMLRNEFQNAGFKSVRWDASGIATGVYLCTLEVGDVVQTKKLILLR